MALQFDNAVTLVGVTIENASQEMEKRGSKDDPKWEPKYTMRELLDPDFRLLRVDNTKEDEIPMRGIGGLLYDEVS